MTISVPIPSDLASQLERRGTDLSRVAYEGTLTEMYRRGLISDGKLAELLGMARLAVHEWLRERNVPLNYSIEQWNEDLDTLDRLRRVAKP
jgi:predicted HTH domain antitoxin